MVVLVFVAAAGVLVVAVVLRTNVGGCRRRRHGIDSALIVTSITRIPCFPEIEIQSFGDRSGGDPETSLGMALG